MYECVCLRACLYVRVYVRAYAYLVKQITQTMDLTVLGQF